MYKITYVSWGEAISLSLESRADAINMYDDLFLDLSNEFLTLTENDKVIAYSR